MKVKKESVLFRVLYGSHLYGTATELSDYDYKAVCLPSMDHLLLNKRLQNVKEKPEGYSHQDKMDAGEVETEYLPLQVFLDDFLAGQTYALEVAFAVADGNFEVMDAKFSKEFWVSFMREMLGSFLTKNVKKMVGYAVSQSKLYGVKTVRYESLVKFVELVESYFMNLHGDSVKALEDMRKTRLQDAVGLLAALTEHEHVQLTTIMNAKGGYQEAPALDVCGKRFPLTNTWSTVLDPVKKTLKEYGTRVKAFEGAGMDWKAFSHATRITEQVLELCQTGKLTFPRPNGKYLLEVKRGNVSIEDATEYFENVFAQIDSAVENSVLQERTPELDKLFEQWKLMKLYEMYFSEN